jgi:predicted transcriptional regulator
MNTLIAKQLAEYKLKIALNASKEQEKGTKIMKNRITLEQKEQILNAFKEGFNGVQVAQKVGLPAHTVNYHILKMKRHGKVRVKSPKVHLGRGKITEEDKKKILDLWATGKYNKAQIANIVGVHQTTAGRLILTGETSSKKVPTTIKVRFSDKSVTHTPTHPPMTLKGLILEYFTTVDYTNDRFKIETLKNKILLAILKND